MICWPPSMPISEATRPGLVDTDHVVGRVGHLEGVRDSAAIPFTMSICSMVICTRDRPVEAAGEDVHAPELPADCLAFRRGMSVIRPGASGARGSQVSARRSILSTACCRAGCLIPHGRSLWPSISGVLASTLSDPGVDFGSTGWAWAAPAHTNASNDAVTILRPNPLERQARCDPPRGQVSRRRLASVRRPSGGLAARRPGARRSSPSSAWMSTGFRTRGQASNTG